MTAPLPGLRLLLRHQLRYLARTPAATAAQVLGTALGVASVVAVHLVSERIQARLDADSVTEYTHILRAESLTEDAYFELRARWRSGMVPGVEAMVPVVEGYGDVEGQPRRLVGIDMLADGRPSETGSEGPRGAAVDLLTRDAVLAGKALGLAPGDVLRLNDTDVAVVGVFGSTADWLVADIATARSVLGRADPTAVWIRSGADAPALERWLPGITAGLRQPSALDLGQGLRARPWSEAEPTRRFALALLFNLGALGMLALFVAAFLVYQSAHANVARRRASDTQLDALGVPRGSLRLLFVGEGILLGLLGAGLGIGAGWALAALLVQGPQPSQDILSLSAVAVAKGGACGVAVAGLGAFAAAVRSRIRALRYGWAAGATLLLVLSVWSGTLAGAFGIVLALCLLQIAVVVPGAGQALKRLFERGRPPVGIVHRVAVRSVADQLSEVHVAVGALSVAVAAAIGIGIMVESFRRDFAGMLDQRLWEGVHVETTAPLPDTAASLEWVRAAPGVTDVRAYGRASVSLDGISARVTLTRGDVAEARRYGYGSAFPQAVLLNENGARALGVEAGASVRLAGKRGTRAVEVAHVFRDYGAPGPRIIAVADHLEPLLDGVAHDSFSVLTDDGQRDAMAAALEERFPGADVRDHVELRRLALEVFDATFEIASQLTLIALLVAVAGLYNALSELQARRRGENRLLYTLGVGQGRIALLSTQQNAVIGIAAAVLAIPLGLAIAWVLCVEVNPAAFGWSIPWTPTVGSILLPVALGIAAALLAGLAPTRAAAHAVTGAARHELA
ncbi:MAG: FtsX-like permease family protein [Gammaproteobacteria bacterium]|nr:FtsX-like permease family protein [Gammaproteobacteria bacterium]